MRSTSSTAKQNFDVTEDHFFTWLEKSIYPISVYDMALDSGCISPATLFYHFFKYVRKYKNILKNSIRLFYWEKRLTRWILSRWQTPFWNDKSNRRIKELLRYLRLFFSGSEMVMEDLRSKIYLKYDVRRWNMGDIYAISSIFSFWNQHQSGIGVFEWYLRHSYDGIRRKMEYVNKIIVLYYY